MKKLKAFTLIELIIGMIVGSIVVSICYSALFMAYKQFMGYRMNRNEINAIMQFNATLNNDFINSNEIYFLDNTILLSCEKSKLEYQLESGFVLRKINQVTDTFNISVSDISVNYCSVNKENLINELTFKSVIFKEIECFHFSKVYAAESLIN